MGALLITHYQRLLDYIKPDFVHVFYNGRIVLSGGPELALELEAKGYDWIKQEFGMPVAGARDGVTVTDGDGLRIASI